MIPFMYFKLMRERGIDEIKLVVMLVVFKAQWYEDLWYYILFLYILIFSIKTFLKASRFIKDLKEVASKVVNIKF